MAAEVDDVAPVVDFLDFFGGFVAEGSAGVSESRTPRFCDVFDAADVADAVDRGREGARSPV